jgi:ADP-ribose pyrophosphatase YjhB (NUDIX family)
VTTDIYPRIAVDVVIFTVANEEELQSMLWDDSLLSPQKEFRGLNNGLSLLVLTMGHGGNTERILPGGFVQPSERIAEAAKRVLRERIGLDLRVPLREVGTYDDPSRDTETRTISFSYWAMADFEDVRKILGGKDRVGLELVNSSGFMERFEKDNGSLAKFDGVSRFGYRIMPKHSPNRRHEKKLPVERGERYLTLDHDQMVFYAWRKLRHAFTGKLDPFNYLGLNPLGEAFRLSDLQEFQEVCRGEQVQRDLFRRSMTSADSFVEQTNMRDSSRPGKPANLYTLQSPPEAAPNDSTYEP